MNQTVHSFRDEPREDDLAAVRDIVSATGFFHDFEVDVAVELVQDRLTQGAASEYFFCFLDDPEGRLMGYTCFGPIACTVGSIDLYWIAVDPKRQGRGLGLELMRQTERTIREGIRGAREPFCSAGQRRRVYLETSGRELYAPTQTFYARAGYSLEARLASFYAPGDDKLVFVKELA